MTKDHKVNILMVDDQPAKLLSYEVILGELDENLLKATSGDEALRYLLKHDVGVVLMDVSMPGVDGFELADMIRQHPRFSRTAIIFISGVHFSDTDKLNGYRRGAVDYISVPVVPEVLRAKVSVFVELHRKTRQLEQLNVELEQRVEERAEQLRQSENQFRTLADSIPQLAWMAHPDGSGFWYNERWHEFSGLTTTELQESGWEQVQHPDYVQRIQQGFRRSRTTGELWQDTFPLRSKTGEYGWFLTRAVPILDAQGSVARWFATATDITDQIAAEEEIRELNRQLEHRITEFEAIMQVLPVGLAIAHDPTCSRITGNSAFYGLFGMAPRSLAISGAEREPFELFRNARQISTSDMPLQQAARTGQAVEATEFEARLQDGSVRYFIASASPLFAMPLQVRGAVGAFFDVTERRRLEDTLRERAELLELASEAIMVHDLSGRIEFWNSGCEELYGWNREEVLGRNVHELLSTTFPVPFTEIQQVLLTKGDWEGNLIHHPKNGREVVVSSRLAFNRERGAILQINRDITVRLQTEQALRQAEKLAAMGRVAGIIAHEINNPLESITNLFYLLKEHPTLDPQARQYAEMAEQELERVAHITRQTLSFYRESKQPIPLAVCDVLDSILELQIRHIQVSGIRLERQYRTEATIHGYPVELRQVFLNLISNAIQAMPRGGTLRVRVHRGIDPHTERSGVCVSVFDTGSGINRTDSKQVFEPFFSTKSEKGTGLGLWISKGIIQKYEGTIQFRTLFLRGRAATCFRVFLPTEVTSATASTFSTDQEAAKSTQNAA